MVSRDEHLEQCKKRALEYLESGDLKNAFMSMNSDLKKHPEACCHPAIALGIILMMNHSLTTKDQMKKFIEDFA